MNFLLLTSFLCISAGSCELQRIQLYKTKSNLKPFRRNKGLPIVPLRSYKGNVCTGQITIGTPPQILRVLFNTAEPDSWAISQKCLDKECAPHRKYDSTKSSTYKPLNKTIMGDELEPFAQDVVQVAGLKVQNQVFRELTSVNGRSIGSGYDGVLGLAFPGYSGEPTVFQNLLSQKLVAQPVISFYLSRYGGELIVGGTNQMLYKGDFTFVNVTSNPQWYFNMDFVNAGNSTVCANGCQANVDTSIEFILGPKSEISTLNKALGAHPVSLGGYRFDCNILDKSPAVTFVLDGKVLTLEPYQYAVKITSSGVPVCISYFNEHDSPQWSLGSAFIAAFYTQFDLGNNRIGFAEAA